MSEQQPPSVAAAPTPQMPESGQVSPDGQFMWDGSNWRPITGYRWEPTEWTRPMQAAVAAFFVINGVWVMLTPLLFYSAIKDAAVKSLQRSSPNLPPDQAQQFLQVTITFGIGIAIFFGVLFLVIGVLTFVRRWTWLFYVDLVILGLNIFGLLSEVFSLLSPGNASPSAFLTVIGLVFSIIALALAVWMLTARIRRGVWAARKTPVIA